MSGTVLQDPNAGIAPPPIQPPPMQPAPLAPPAQDFFGGSNGWRNLMLLGGNMASAGNARDSHGLPVNPGFSAFSVGLANALNDQSSLDKRNADAQNQMALTATTQAQLPYIGPKAAADLAASQATTRKTGLESDALQLNNSLLPASIAWQRQLLGARSDALAKGPPSDDETGTSPGTASSTTSLPTDGKIGPRITNLPPNIVPPEQMSAMLDAATTGRGLPQGLRNVVAGLPKPESSNNANAVNATSGAIGLTQTMPSTARRPGYGVTPVDQPADLLDPQKSLNFAAEYLYKRGKEQFGMTDADWAGKTPEAQKKIIALVGAYGGYTKVDPTAYSQAVLGNMIANQQQTGSASTPAAPAVGPRMPPQPQTPGPADDVIRSLQKQYPSGATAEPPPFQPYQTAQAGPNVQPPPSASAPAAPATPPAQAQSAPIAPATSPTQTAPALAAPTQTGPSTNQQTMTNFVADAQARAAQFQKLADQNAARARYNILMGGAAAGFDPTTYETKAQQYRQASIDVLKQANDYQIKVAEQQSTIQADRGEGTVIYNGLTGQYSQTPMKTNWFDPVNQREMQGYIRTVGPDGRPITGANGPNGEPVGLIPGTAVPLKPTTAETERTKTTIEQRAVIDQQANLAITDNYNWQNMRHEAAGWSMGKFADIRGDVSQYLQATANLFGLKDFQKDQITDYTSFDKGANVIVREAVKATSGRAAVQEFKLISDSLPHTTMSQDAFENIADQMQAINDLRIAKQQYVSDYLSQGGNPDRMEYSANRDLSPGAFLLARMGSTATGKTRLQRMLTNLSATAEGRGEISRMKAGYDFAQKNGYIAAADGGQ